MAGQTISDRLLAAKHSIAGQGLAKSVCKATTEELLAPKKKHLDYLIHCTNEPNVSIPQLANLLIERSQNTNWIVVFKSLITVHHLLCYGNERFTQYLASSNSTFQLSNFLDKSGQQGYEMSPFIRRYARYLNEKALSYRTVAFDFCKVKRGKEDGVLRTMNADKLLKTLPVLQSQLDALLEFDCTPADLSNSVINMAFMLLFRDLIRLFAGYNDSIINLLEKYFDMNKKQCREALDLYKKFLIRMDRVAEFLKVAENVGIDKGEIPDLTKAPSSLLDALEQHLATLEGKKAVSTPTQAAVTQQRSDVKTGVNVLSSTSSAFGTAAQQADVVDESIAKQVVAEEEAILNQYKAKVQSPVSGAGVLSTTNPFLASPTQPIVDLLSTPNQPVVTSNNVNQTGKAIDDLLQLGNPFADTFPPQSTTVAPLPISAQNGVKASVANNVWMTNGFSCSNSLTNAFVDDNSFSSVFGDANHSVSMSASSTAAAVISGGVAEQPICSLPSTSVPNPFGANEVVCNADLLDSTDFFLSSMAENKLNDACNNNKREEIGQLGKPVSGPPPRPPPPTAAVSGNLANKTAMDDLNDSIRVALGSPSHVQSTPNVGLKQFQSQPSLQSQTLTQPQAFPSSMISSQIPTASMTATNIPVSSQGMFGSPAKFSGMPVSGVGMCVQSGGITTQSATTTTKVLTGDLDSSLASLAENLTIDKTAQTKQMQWNSPKNTVKTGAGQSNMWTPQPMAATTGANYRPMGMPPSNMATTFPPGYPQMGRPTVPPLVVPTQAVTGRIAVIPQAEASVSSSQVTQLDPFGAF